MNTSSGYQREDGSSASVTESSVSVPHQFYGEAIADAGRRPRCLIGCSGSVAALKIPELAVALSRDFDVLIVCTRYGEYFLMRASDYNDEPTQQFEALSSGKKLLFKDADEWSRWNHIGDEVLHIELRRWADVLLIAPASANTIAKAANGLADNLLLSVMRAWDLRKPCVLCPAMNTVMWEHPSTAAALAALSQWGWDVLGPVEKLLACNEVGKGAMASVSDIVGRMQQLKCCITEINPALASKSNSKQSGSNSTRNNKSNNSSSNNIKDSSSCRSRKGSSGVGGSGEDGGAAAGSGAGGGGGGGGASLVRLLLCNAALGVGIGVGVAVTLLALDYSAGALMGPGEVYLRPGPYRSHTML